VNATAQVPAVLLPTLYVFVQEGCEACAAAKPHLQTFRQRHPLDVLVIPLHLERREWQVAGWAPRATPGYALVLPGGKMRKHVGAMTAEELEAWAGGEL
jgi:hypothetical protein